MSAVNLIYRLVLEKLQHIHDIYHLSVTRLKVLLVMTKGATNTKTVIDCHKALELSRALTLQGWQKNRPKSP